MQAPLRTYFVQTQLLFSNCMKRHPKKQPIQEHDHQSSHSADCSCQMLDTSLDDVAESDCTCSQCLEANLQAFNELKQVEEQANRRERQDNKRGQSTRPASNYQVRATSQNTSINNKRTSQINGYKSTQKIRNPRLKTSQPEQQLSHAQYEENKETDFPRFSRECVNQYIKITKHRARSYLLERKNLSKAEEQRRKELKNMIKSNLQALKFTAKNLIGKPKAQKQKDTEIGTNYHKPYYYKSNRCSKLKPYEPNFEQIKGEIEAINDRIRKYKQQNKPKPYQCPDQCPKHHMRTSKKKMIQIEKFIENNAKAYFEAQKQKRKAKIQQKKLKEAKLRAIDLKCKQKVTKSKKYDPSDEKTSFHNSIDHFSTFSELRVNNEGRLEQKKQRKKIKQALKDGKQLQQAIYQNLEQQLVGDHPAIHSKINVESRYIQGQQQRQQWCEKIVKDARIKPPKQIKKDDQQIKKAKDKKKIEQSKTQKNKNVKNLSSRDLKRQQERRKQIQAEIQRKKQQILNHYQKRNSNIVKNDPKNKILREQYEQSLKQDAKDNKRQQNKSKKGDPYRAVYKHQASKDPRQMKIVGDPLIEQYEYDRNSRRAKQLQVQPVNKQLFSSSGRQLMQKKVLKV